jgi:heat shock protein HslJ
MTQPLRPLPVLASLVLLFAALVACDAADPAPPGGGSFPPTLQASSWSVLTVAGRAPQPGVKLTIDFGAATAKGSGGCNQFGGSYQYDPATGRIAFKELGMTAMACVENARMVLEAAYMQTLQGATHVELDPQGHLVITGPAGAVVLARLLEG